MVDEKSYTEEDFSDDRSAKIERQRVVMDIINNNSSKLKNQDDILEELKKRGYTDATQPTLSRDLKELGVVKVRGVYTVSSEARRKGELRNLSNSFHDWGVQPPESVSLLALKTDPTYAHAVGGVLKKIFPDNVLGSLVGNDLVVLVVKKENLAMGTSEHSKFEQELNDIFHPEQKSEHDPLE